MAIKDALLPEYDHETGTTRRLLERVPDDRLAWKPHEKSMTLGGLATHLSNLPQWGGIILANTSFDLAGAPPNVERTSRADILQAFDSSTGAARAALDKSDGEFTAPWTLKRAGHEMFTMPRIAAFRTFVLNHIIHHRAQLGVYLRMQDVPLPPLYGPTADEQM